MPTGYEVQTYRNIEIIARSSQRIAASLERLNNLFEYGLLMQLPADWTERLDALAALLWEQGR